MPFCFFRAVLVAVLTASLSAQALAQDSVSARNLGASATIRRVALVIGNDAYKHVPPLEKAGNDARAMGRALQQAGFETRTVLDANRSQMNKAINQFADDIAGGGIGVFFFAGHGVQVNNQNFLIPIDLQDIQREADVADQGVSLQGLQDKLAEVRAKFSLLVIDACRDNPLPKKAGRALGGTRGLSQASSAEGQMVVFSAGANQQALDKLFDSDPHPNGVFTREFLPWLAKPGVSIRDAVQGVRSAVRARAKSVNHEQFPAIYDQAEGNFYFVEGTGQGSSAQGTQVASLTPQFSGARTREQIEDELWDAIKNGDKASVFEEYLKQYPKGRYLAQARVKIAKLKAEARQPAVAPAPTLAVPAKSADPETQFWNEVRASGERDYLDAYLKQYPKGKYIALAKVELKKIDERQQQEAQQAEQKAWEQAKADNTATAYVAYLERYPNGGHAALAQAARQKVQREAAERERLVAEQVKREQIDAALREEAEHWKRADAASDSATVQGYLDRYPAGRYVAQARFKLAEVKKKEVEGPRPGKIFKDCADCPEMVVIPAGNFEMGSNSGGSDEKPVHTVRIGKPFALGKTEVTQGQWKVVMGSNPSRFSSCGDDCPVDKVSWNDAQDFVRKLSQKTGKSYRLPSEAEWEHACRAGGTHTYCGSESVDSVAWSERNSGDRPHSVAGRQGNAWGLYDMSGNVWEWVEDCWNGNYNGAPSDGSAWTSGDCGQRVLRGGSWYEDPLRSAFRIRTSSGHRDYLYGFRLARTLF